MKMLIALSCAMMMAACTSPLRDKEKEGDKGVVETNPVVPSVAESSPKVKMAKISIPSELMRDIGEPARHLQIKIASWLEQHGYKDHKRDAILKLIWRESRFVPDVIAKNGSACLFQWIGSRKTALFHGRRSCPSWEAQMAFMDDELHNVKAYAAFWNCNPKSSYPVLRQHFAMGQ